MHRKLRAITLTFRRRISVMHSYRSQPKPGGSSMLRRKTWRASRPHNFAAIIRSSKLSSGFCEGLISSLDLTTEPLSSAGDQSQPRPRSEEHTSELQSLMRSSYAVFCLKKKNKKYQLTQK